MTRKNRIYTPECKEQAVKLAHLNGFTHTAQELGVAVSNLHRWKAEQQTKTTPEPLQAKQELEELKRLREENKRLQMENTILKKAAAYFAKDHL